jgi:VanZ family protein
VITHGKLRYARAWWFFGLALVAYVIWGCLIPPDLVPDFHVNDKIEHAGAYFLMTFWFGGLLQRRHFPLMIIAFLALGAAIEVAQWLMGLGRQADVWDFAADSVGVAAAIVPAYLGLDSWMFYVEQRFGVS